MPPLERGRWVHYEVGRIIFSSGIIYLTIFCNTTAKEIVQYHEQAAQLNPLTINIEAENTPDSSVNTNCESQEEISAPTGYGKYEELSAWLNLLNETQIAALWSALSERLDPNLLERLVIQTQQKLSAR